jgi:hypothetical protein
MNIAFPCGLCLDPRASVITEKASESYIALMTQPSKSHSIISITLYWLKPLQKSLQVQGGGNAALPSTEEHQHHLVRKACVNDVYVFETIFGNYNLSHST